MSLTKQACSFVQVGLQSSGYHTSTTFFLPTKSESFTSFLSWFCSVKSGAVCPTPIAMFCPPINFESTLPSYRIRSSPPNGTSILHPTSSARLGVHFLQKSCRPMTSCLPKQLAPDDAAARISRSLSFRRGQLRHSRGPFFFCSWPFGNRTALLQL